MYTKEIAWSLRKRVEMTCKRFMITYKHIAIKNNLNKKEAFIINFISLQSHGWSHSIRCEEWRDHIDTHSDQTKEKCSNKIRQILDEDNWPDVT